MDSSSDTAQKQHDELLERMSQAKKRWDEEEGDDDDDDTDKLLSQAMELAIQQGKGWSPGEKEAYMAKILDDDFIPPLFASNQEDLEKSGLADAFSSLVYDNETPTHLMLDFKKKGNDAFMNGKRNQAKNVQYYRDAVNNYYEAFAWAQKVEPVPEAGSDGNVTAETNDDNNGDPTYTEKELDQFKATLCANAAMAHMQLKNWGHVRDDATKALAFDDQNVKAWYRLAKAHQALCNWEAAGDAIDSGLAVDSDNKDLLKLQKLLEKRVAKARQARQQRERARAERVARVKDVWKHCKTSGIRLGRVPLVSSVTDGEEDDDGTEEFRWHHHHPHSGRLPQQQRSLDGSEWTWPCMFLYPSHGQSDFVESFGESEMIALRMAQMFPESDDNGGETAMPWDYNNEFTCSNLAVYVEVHCTEAEGDVVHPESVAQLTDQGAAMRFYEASRALKGDEGPEMANLARAVERKHLHKQRKAWKKQHGSLWAKPDPCPVVRVHPAVALRDVLLDERLVVPNFLVTFIVFPENHPAHEAYLKDHCCIGIIQPEGMKES